MIVNIFLERAMGSCLSGEYIGFTSPKYSWECQWTDHQLTNPIACLRCPSKSSDFEKKCMAPTMTAPCYQQFQWFCICWFNSIWWWKYSEIMLYNIYCLEGIAQGILEIVRASQRQRGRPTSQYVYIYLYLYIWCIIYI